MTLYELLQEARTTGRRIVQIPDDAVLRNIGDAYAIAGRLAPEGGPLAGWKIGATSPRGQQLLGLQEPFFGRVFAATVHASPAKVRARDDAYAVEAEIALRIARDLPPRAGVYTVDDIADAVDAIAPALELNRPSYERPFDVGGLALVADNGVNAGACLGPWRHAWRSLDLSALEVMLVRDDEPPIAGSSGAVLGHPLVAVTWLANALLSHGCQLSRGQIVLSGATTPPVDVGRGQRVRAEFTALGKVELELPSG